MVFAIAAAVWLLALVVLARLLWIAKAISPLTRTHLAVWCLLLVGACALLFRPHEGVLAGQDHGAYLNAAASFGRHGRLFYTDPLLAGVPEEARRDFLMGHAGYGRTKDNCLTVHRLSEARIGPRFQPLYPIVLAPVFRLLAHPSAILYVAPLFALLTALALRTAALQLFPHPWAGTLAFMFYALTPLVVWHGRSARPEMAAGFFLFGGLPLLFHALRGGLWSRWPDILIAALCVAAAPFFHVTAWLAAIPLAAVVAILILRGRTDLILYPPLAAAGVALFAWQCLRVTDYYTLRRFIRPLTSRPALVWTGAAALVVVLVGLYFAGRRLHRKARDVEPDAPRTGSLLLRWIGAGAVVGLLVGIYLWWKPIEDRRFTVYLYRYFYPTDLRVARVYLSRSVSLLALAGMAAWVLRRGPATRERVILLCGVLPAACLVGRMYDLFMTRYLVMTLVPLAVLSLASLVALIPVRTRGHRAALLLAAGVILFLPMARRAPMLRVREDRGMLQFLSGFADDIRAEKGVLLCEYSRVAAPFEHLFGVPTLGLDNETRSDYSDALVAWENVLAARPDRTAFFLTPFQPPVSDRFQFERVREGSLQYEELRAGRYQLPSGTAEKRLGLTLYRMTPGRPVAPALPYVRGFDGGNMGLKRFSRFRVRNWEIRGAQVGLDRAATVELPEPIPPQTPVRMRLCFHAAPPESAPATPEVYFNGNQGEPADCKWQRLVNEWWLLSLQTASHQAVESVTVRSDVELLWTDLHAEAGSQTVTLTGRDLDRGDTDPARSAFVGRWIRTGGSFLAPVPAGGGSILLLMLLPPESGPFVTVSLRTEEGHEQHRAIPTGVWTWQAWPLADPAEPGFVWFSLETDPAWDPGLGNYPSDLAARLGSIACTGVCP